MKKKYFFIITICLLMAIIISASAEGFNVNSNISDQKKATYTSMHKYFFDSAEEKIKYVKENTLENYCNYDEQKEIFVDIPILDKENFPEYYNLGFYERFTISIDNYKLFLVKNDVTYGNIIYIENLTTGALSGFFKPLIFMQGFENLLFLEDNIVIITKSVHGWKDISIYNIETGDCICDSTGTLVSSYYVNTDKNTLYYVEEGNVHDMNGNIVSKFETNEAITNLRFNNGEFIGLVEGNQKVTSLK